MVQSIPSCESGAPPLRIASMLVSRRARRARAGCMSHPLPRSLARSIAPSLPARARSPRDAYVNGRSLGRLAVEREVRRDEMVARERREQRELAAEDRRRDDPCKLLGVRTGHVAAPRDTERAQAGGLRGEAVPPPTVPHATLGIVTANRRSWSPSTVSLGVASTVTMLVDDSTFWAGSWPHARNMAVTTLEACALKPPSEPPSAEPIFARVHLDHADGVRQEDAPADGAREDYLRGDGLAAPFDPVDGGLLVAHVARERGSSIRRTAPSAPPRPCSPPAHHVHPIASPVAHLKRG